MINVGNASKDVAERLDYKINWADFLDGDTIASAVVTVDPPGPTLERTDVDSSSVTAWLSGGTPGVLYTLTYSIVTASSPSRKADRTIQLLVT